MTEADSVSTGQEFFLDLIARKWPAIVTELHRDGYLPCLRMLGGSLRLPKTNHYQVIADVEYQLWSSDAAVVRRLVREWAIRWHLNVDWVRWRALDTLIGWASTHNAIDLTHFASPTTMLNPIGDGEPFNFAGWDPSIESWERWRGDLDYQLAKYLDGYRERHEARAESRGLVRHVNRRVEHFEWLAMYQLGNESFVALARRLQQDRATVTDAIRAVADLIELPIRQSHGGKPKPSE